MAPSAVDGPSTVGDITMTDARTYPPANIFPVKETTFETYLEPQTDGRKKALQQSGTPAIVIDNGTPNPFSCAPYKL